ncbi:perforin-1-like isoform X3 [Scleropages formosus]|uniref:Perforin 1 n=1 Tax=Scleropages formosus TaxID=113540 RepID=A0A8C9S6N5_SCLFO|nr:perforin-1-like isoform X3 [Scleropages formosus]
MQTFGTSHPPRLSAGMQCLFVLWLLLWSLPPTLPCTTGNPAECQKARLVPGSNLAGEGFDVVTMQRKQAYVIDVETWKIKPNKTCTLCTNPYMGGEVQKVPLALVDWRVLPHCKLQVSSVVYESSEHFVESTESNMEASWKIGLHLPSSSSVMMGGTHSKLAKMAMDKSKMDKYSFIKQDVRCAYYSYRLKKDPPLHPEFTQSLQHLPATYSNSTKAEYRRLLDTYGTHFIKKVKLGGRVSSVTSLRLCEAALSHYTETEVKDCLEAEASVKIKVVRVSPSVKFCKADLKQRDARDTFSSQFHDRVTEVEGGEAGVPDLLFSDMPNVFNDWTDSLKKIPGVVSYSLDPLHLLVHTSQSKKEGLKKAIEDYILENALYKHCSGKCSGGSKPSSHDCCNCVCNPSQYITSHCCSANAGLAQLTVKVLRATGLWGDTFSGTDGFVKISFGGKSAQTGVIYNNNNPEWKTEFPLDMVTLSLGTELKLEVWDEDKDWYKWWNDNLGECKVSPESGSHSGICPLNHGTLYYSYTVECAPGLGGTTCRNYIPAPMSASLAPLYTSRNAVNVTASLLTHLRMGHPVVDPLLFLGPPKWKNTSTAQALADETHIKAFPEL